MGDETTYLDEDEKESDGVGLEDTIPLRGGPILLTDDHQVSLKVLKRSFSMELKKASINVEIITINGGTEAVEMYKR